MLSDKKGSTSAKQNCPPEMGMEWLEECSDCLRSDDDNDDFY